jgi:cobalt-zinc-cadmium efflux system outer membrane protein
VSFGPRYKRENNENLFGGEIAVPLPFFNRNQEEVASALANQNVSRTELEGRLLAVKQEIDSAYSKFELASATIDSYGKDYSSELEKMMALTRKAYESGEMNIFEFSAARDRFVQARTRSLESALA